MPRVAVDAQAAPAKVTDAARQLGERIRTARVRRGLRQADLARRAGVTVPTLRRVESGSLGTGLGAYLAALWAMGLEGQLGALADPAQDREGYTLEAARRTERVRVKDELSDEF
jgi:transcriptional regulator with XRE-family HTH domain